MSKLDRTQPKENQVIQVNINGKIQNLTQIMSIFQINKKMAGPNNLEQMPIISTFLKT
jgi:hypothetical protein